MDESQDTNLTQTETVTPHEVTTATESVAPKPFYKRNPLLTAIVVAVVLLASAGHYVYVNTYAGGGTVAVVNGMRIYAEELDESVLLFEQSAAAQGADITDATLKTQLRMQALEVLINNALIITASKEEGFTASTEARDAKYAELVIELGGEAQLTARIAEMGLSKEKLEDNIDERILADQYIESQTTIEDASVSEEEVLAFIKTLGETNKNLPPLEEIRPQVEAQIVSQKQQQIVMDLIERLRGEATIDMSI